MLIIFSSPEPEEEATEKIRKQKLFDFIWAYSATMTKQSVSTTGTCQYRQPSETPGEAVNKCFIGATLPNRIYRKKMDTEVLSVVDILGSYPNVAEHYEAKGFTTNVDFLYELQDIHDSYFESRKNLLRVLAKDYGLNVPA